MKKSPPPVVVLPADPALARYDTESAFPEKVARAKASFAKVDRAKLEALLARPDQKPE